MLTINRHSQRSERRLVGTWVVQIQLHNCETGATVGGPFISLLTFDRGAMTETTSNASFYPAVRGPHTGCGKKQE
jgi:hypothetical protein